MRRTALLLLLLAIGVPASGLRAQTVGVLPRTLELPASTRALALGNATMTDAGHADALFYHPGLIRRASGFGLDLQRWDSKSSTVAASAATGWLGGTFGIGLRTLQYGAPGAGPAGAAPAGSDHLFDFGGLPVSERVATLGYGRALFGLDVGVAGHLVEEHVASARAATMLFDVGVSKDLGPVVAAVAYRGIGDAPTPGNGSFERPEAISVTVGGLRRQLGIFDLAATTTFDWIGDELVPGGGLEIAYWPVSGRTFIARVGGRRVVDGDMSPLSVGFAFQGDDVILEWAFQPSDGAPSGTHRFGMRWR